MKKFIIALLLAMPVLAYAQQEVKTDSLSATLDEVVVTADAQIETAKKVILRPTKLEKKHSTNGYALLENMNLPDFNVNASTKSIFYGITPLVLLLPLYPKIAVYSADKKQDFKERLANVKHADLELWAKENLSENMVALRSKTLKNAS